MSICISRSASNHSDTANDWRQRVVAMLESLLQILSSKDFAKTEVDHLRRMIESLPPDNTNSELASSYLSKAQRYLRSNEVGAAMYELRLLLGWLQCC